MKRKKGLAFQLDVVAGIIVILILTAVVVSNALPFTTKSRISRAEADTTALGGYVSEYKFETGSYPDTLTSLTQTKGQYGPWISKVPEDPWGNVYHYKKTDAKFVVYSLGPDKSESGSSAENGIAAGDIGFAGR
ncbi:MAG: type secretion system protein [Firmicutes bacterium]|nr:type secretion system protein [Bacillota bacterium]